MKRIKTILAVILLAVLAGCGENKQSDGDLIIVDVSKSYPEKELILQDFMDVEYIALETNDEFLTQGSVQDAGKEYLLVINRNNDGDIFIFDRKTGKGVRKINRQGQGAEEYAGINGITLDETNGEIFV
ncbi:MAG: 6-bladed beta-propeller, partial [Tannerellaceae bacterium]|nr:6-bladed beta-propeller [Tannerellaceae bacterium]